MPQKARIIIVCPEPAVQTSLCFMLEAEGHTVRVVDALRDAAELTDYDCVIVDHKLIGKSPLRLGELAALARPVVLLVDQRKDFSIPEVIRFVEKPLLGRSVIEAVGSALARR